MIVQQLHISHNCCIIKNILRCYDCHALLCKQIPHSPPTHTPNHSMVRQSWTRPCRHKCHWKSLLRARWPQSGLLSSGSSALIKACLVPLWQIHSAVLMVAANMDGGNGWFVKTPKSHPLQYCPIPVILLPTQYHVPWTFLLHVTTSSLTFPWMYSGAWDNLS